MQIAWGKSLFFILGLAIFALLIWLLEVTVFIGWAELDWLFQFHYSIFFIGALTIGAYLLPFYNTGRFPTQRLFSAGLELYFAILAAYFLEKALLLTLYNGFYGLFNNQNWLFVMQGITLVITALSFYLVTQRWLTPLRWQQALVVGGCILLPIPLSLLTLQFLPSFDGNHTFIDAVKMGYPFFWIVIMMGLAGIWGLQLVKPVEPTITQDDILDDFSNE